MAWQILLLASPGSNCSYVKNPSIPSRKSFLTEASWKWVSVTPHQKQQKLRILTQLLLASGKTSLNGPAATSQASPVSYAIVVVAQPVTPWTAAHQASPSFTISWSWLKLMSIESVMPSNHLILCHPLLLLPSIFPSIRVFSNELALCIRWPKYWSFTFSLSPSNEYSRLISFRIDWFDLLEVQDSFKN